MRAREFTINVPITIKINGDGDPEIDMPSQDAPADGDEKDLNPVMVPPLQQDIELKKAELGKESPVINKMVAPSEVGKEPDEQTQSDNQTLQRLKTLATGI
jgi:hypothetical protein